MRRTEKSAESSFVAATRFRMGGLAGTAMALVIGFLEQAAAHAAESAQSATVLSDQLANTSSSAAADTHQAPDTHHASHDAASSEHMLPGHAHDDALSSPALATHSDANDGPGSIMGDSGSILGDVEGFWFDADGPVHIVLGGNAEDHSLTGEFTGFPDRSANIPASHVEVSFTSAASSSFQYSGPSILDTAPGGSHSDQTVTISSEIPTPNANVASAGQVFGEQSAVVFENNLPVDGLKPATESAAAHAGSGTVLEAWNGDLGRGLLNGDNAGGTGNAGSGSIGVPTAADGQGLVINVVYDASVANAPAGFTQTVANVVSFYESQFSNPVTLTIDVGYGEVDGQALAPFALGESQAYMTSVSYAQLQTALVNSANTIGETAAAATLAGTSPVNGQYWIPTAEAQALGLAPVSDGVDGYAGFTNIPGLVSYDSTNTSGTPPSNEYDLFGAIAHEFSEVMGRQMLDGAQFGGAPGYTALDLFHYSAPGVRDFSGTTPGYASPDGGSTNLGNFNTNQNGDFGDWASSAGNNSYLAFSYPGVLNSVTASDLTVMNLLGWDSAPQAAAPTPPPAPVTPPSQTIVAGPGPQTLYGEPGDTLIGGGGRDNFVFSPGFGNETIENFHAKHDVISVPSSSFSDFAAVWAYTYQSGANTVIWGGDANDSISLAGFQFQHLHAHNFHFIV
jgi:hypothetical protein